MLTPHSRLTGPEQGEQASLKENTSVSGSTLVNRKFSEKQQREDPNRFRSSPAYSTRDKRFCYP